VDIGDLHGGDPGSLDAADSGSDSRPTPFSVS
jgi:hypothetical protein